MKEIVSDLPPHECRPDVFPAPSAGIFHVIVVVCQQCGERVCGGPCTGAELERITDRCVRLRSIAAPNLDQPQPGGQRGLESLSDLIR